MCCEGKGDCHCKKQAQVKAGKPGSNFTTFRSESDASSVQYVRVDIALSSVDSSCGNKKG